MKNELFNQVLSKLDFLLASNININGYNIQILGIMFMDFTFPWICKSHYHDFYELHYILDGECHAEINREHFLVQPGYYYITKPGVIHSQHSTSHVGFAIRWKIDGSQEFKKANIDHNFRIYKYLKRINDACHQSLCDSDLQFQDKILSIAMDADKNNHFVTQLSVITLLVTIPELLPCSAMTMKEMGKLCDNQESIVEACVRYITDNCLQDINVEDVAESVHLSYGYVSRVFKQKMGFTINKEINQARLKKAQYFLLSSSESIQGIAHRVGFSTENYFSTVFKKTFQCSPTEYRKSQRRLDE